MKNKNGFTLVELLAVIVILGILIIIGVPAVFKVINSSKKEIDALNMETLIDSANLYLQDFDQEVYKFKNTTGSTITIAKNGHTYANGAELTGYDFKCYVIEQGGIDIKITDLIAKGYYNEYCNYSTNPDACKVKNTCVLRGKIKYSVSNGYYVTETYDTTIKSGCDLIKK